MTYSPPKAEVTGSNPVGCAIFQHHRQRFSKIAFDDPNRRRVAAAPRKQLAK
jgi:hypothetical protein